jgi:hypothetical protein
MAGESVNINKVYTINNYTLTFVCLYITCEVVPLRVDFFKMAAVAMETAKMKKKLKTQK